MSKCLDKLTAELDAIAPHAHSDGIVAAMAAAERSAVPNKAKRAALDAAIESELGKLDFLERQILDEAGRELRRGENIRGDKPQKSNPGKKVAKATDEIKQAIVKLGGSLNGELHHTPEGAARHMGKAAAYQADGLEQQETEDIGGKAEDFVLVDGKKDWGEISGESSKEIRRQAGKIRLNVGEHHPENDSGNIAQTTQKSSVPTVTANLKQHFGKVVDKLLERGDQGLKGGVKVVQSVDDAMRLMGNDKYSILPPLREFYPKNTVVKVLLNNNHHGDYGSGRSEPVYLRQDGGVLIDGLIVYPGDTLYPVEDTAHESGTRFYKNIPENVRADILREQKNFLERIVRRSEGINREAIKPTSFQKNKRLEEFDFNLELELNEKYEKERYPNANMGNSHELAEVERIDGLSKAHDLKALEDYVVDDFFKNSKFVIGGYLHVSEGQAVTKTQWQAILNYQANGGKLGRTAFDANTNQFSLGESRIQGFYNQNTGLTYLIADNLDATTAPAVLQHEIVHGTATPKVAQAAQKLLASRNSTFIKPALKTFLDGVHARLEEAGELNNPDEYASYIVEQAAILGRRDGFSGVDTKFLSHIEKVLGKRVADLIRAFAAAVRVALLKRGVAVQLTVDDLGAFALAGLGKAARGDVNTLNNGANTLNNDKESDKPGGGKAGYDALSPTRPEPTLSRNGAGADENKTTQPGESSSGIRYSIAPKELLDKLIHKKEPIDDQNYELNRRIREQHKTISDKSRQWLKQQFSPGGLLPKVVFGLKIDRDSQMNAVEFMSHNIVSGLDRAVKLAYKSKFEDLPQATQDLIADRLSGKEVELPKIVKERVDAMRLYIDKHSARYAKILEEEAYALIENDGSDKAKAKFDLLETISKNIGSYVNRSYRAFDDKDWAKKVPDNVLNDARAYIAKRFEEDPTGNAQRVINDILKTGTAYDTFEQYIKESKLGAKDLSILKKRQQIAPEIRALLGEYTDARINFVKSATKMSRLIFNDDFLKAVKREGIAGDFLFDEESRPSGEHTVKIAADASSPMSPLNGYYTYPEINQAFIDALDKEKMANWHRMIVQTNGLIKGGKTFLSPTTAARNFMSAYFFTLANGHFDLGQMGKSIGAFKTYFNKDNGKVDYLRELKELGVIYDTPYAGEMMALLADSKFESALMGEGKGKLTKAKLAIKDWIDIAQKFYQFGDDFWKIIGYENEKQLLMDKKGMSEAEAKKAAAKRIRDTYPTYSMIGKGIQSLRRFPLVGTFVSFPAEIIRTSFNMLKYAKQDMDENRELGMRRVAGLVVVSGLAYAAQAIAMSVTGMDDDDEEALRDLAPPWSKNANIIPMGRDKDGSLIYMDMSFMDPYNYWKKPINALLRDIPMKDKAIEVGRELFTPFFGEDILFGTINDIWQNKKGSGGEVYNPDDSPANVAADIANHLRKNLQPGIANNIEKISDAMAGYKSPSGKVNTVQEELAALVGFRVSRLNPKIALYHASFDFTDKMANATKILSNVAKNPNKVSEGRLKDAMSLARETRGEAINGIRRLVKAAENSGLSRAEIINMMRLGKISKGNVALIMSSGKDTWSPGKAFLKSNIERAPIFFDDKTKKMLEERRKLLSHVSDNQ